MNNWRTYLCCMSAERVTETKAIQELVISAVCMGLGVPRSEVLNSTGKDHNSVFNRLLTCYFLRLNTNLSDADIAGIFGKKNSNQVAYAVERIEGELKVRETITTRQVGLIQRLIDCKVQRQEPLLIF